MDRLDVQPGQGVGSIKFGMTPDEVIALFDETSVYEEWMGGNLNDSLLYHGMIFGFDRCDGSGPLKDSALGEVIVRERDDVSLYGKPMTMWTKPELLQRFATDGIRMEGQHFIYNTLQVHAPDFPMDLRFDDDGRLLELHTW